MTHSRRDFLLARWLPRPWGATTLGRPAEAAACGLAASPSRADYSSLSQKMIASFDPCRGEKQSISGTRNQSRARVPSHLLTPTAAVLRKLFQSVCIV